VVDEAFSNGARLVLKVTILQLPKDWLLKGHLCSETFRSRCSRRTTIAGTLSSNTTRIAKSENEEGF
jgi:hypothetical protein